MNRRLKKHILEPSCTLVIGDRGAGKSCFFAMIVEQMIKQDIPVYCQYPFDGAYVIPMTHKVRKDGTKSYNIDKDWLYGTDLSHSCILIDEAKTVYPARGWKDWTAQDDEFFNFIRHNHMTVFLATQHSDGIDLNVKRNCDETMFITRPPLLDFFNFSYIECSRTVNVKIADKNSEIIGKNGRSGAYKVNWDIGEIPIGNYRFYRKPFYGKYNTDFMFNNKTPAEPQLWSDVLNGDFSAGEIIIR